MESFMTAEASVIAEHASGRPWIVGAWPKREIGFFSSGYVRLILLGKIPSSLKIQTTILNNVDIVTDLDHITAGIPGSFFAVASVDGTVRAQGSLSSIRRLWFTTIRSNTVAATDPRALADATGATLNVDRLATQLAYPLLPYPLADRSLWNGVRDVPADSALVLDRDGNPRLTRRRLSPSPSALALEQGAARLRER